MKKLFAFISMILCVMLLSGCMAVEVISTINPDGSVIVQEYAGYTEDTLYALAEMQQDQDPEATVAAMKADSEVIVRNGETYYGEWTKTEYTSVEEFNETGVDADTGVQEKYLKQDTDGAWTLTHLVTGNEAEEATDGAGGDASLEGMYMSVTYKFPAPVTQTKGITEGVTISGNTVTLDIMKISDAVSSATTFEFTTKGGEKKLAFDDVSPGAWYFDAVTALADSGLVNGVAERTFMPDGTLTYAQFCQLLVRAAGIEVGEENGYWAGKAIRVAIDSGCIISRGEITPQNYDVPITREAAIAAMFYAQYDRIDFAAEYSHEDLVEFIPDYDSISDEYKNDVVGAYIAEITTGIDENRTFNPKGILKRSEICQLFYNSGWTTVK